MEVWNNQLLLAEGSWHEVQQAAVSVRDELVRGLIRRRAVPCEHGMAYWAAIPRSVTSSLLFYVQHAPVWIATGAYTWLHAPDKSRALTAQLRAGVHERWQELKHLGTKRSGFLAFVVAKWRAAKVFWRHWARSISTKHYNELRTERNTTAAQIGRLVCAGTDDPAQFVAELTLSSMMGSRGVGEASAASAAEYASVRAETPEAALAQLQSLLDGQLPAVKSSIPSELTRWWPVLGVCVLLAFKLTGSWQSVVAWFQQSVLDTLQSFVNNWVVDPLRRVYMTIRHDPTNEVALMAKESLVSDTTSLERMVVDFARDIDPQLTPADLDAVRLRASNGDLTPVMAAYERQLASPITNIVTGKLVRTLLIQVQKGKVDLEVALSGIDRLLQSQQLVFGLVAAIPALGVVWWVTKQAVAMSYRQLYGSEASNAATERQQVVTALSNLDAVAQQAPQELQYIDVGLVFVHVALVRSALRSDTLGSRQLHKVLDRMLGHAVERNGPALLADLDRAFIRYQLR